MTPVNNTYQPKASQPERCRQCGCVTQMAGGKKRCPVCGLPEDEPLARSMMAPAAAASIGSVSETPIHHLTRKGRKRHS